MLHANTAFVIAEGPIGEFHIGLWVWSSLPYLISLLVALKPLRAPIALGFSLASLLGDFVMFYLVFVGPKLGSTQALGLLWMPLWNLLFIGPFGAALSHAYAMKANIEP